MKPEDVVNKLRLMKTDYASNHIGSDPAMLPEHLTEFEAYLGILYSHYAEFMKQYTVAEAKVIAEENDERDDINSTAKGRDDKRTVDEKNDRIAIRMAELKSRKLWLEAELKGGTLHINTIQSKMKRQSDEAKGVQ